MGDKVTIEGETLKASAPRKRKSFADAIEAALPSARRMIEIAEGDEDRVFAAEIFDRLNDYRRELLGEEEVDLSPEKAS